MFLCVIASVLQICACSKVPADGAYRVEVEQTSTDPSSVSRLYAIQTTSPRRIQLKTRSMAVFSASLAPIRVADEKTRSASVMVTVRLMDETKEPVARIEMIVKIDGTTSRAEESLRVPSASELASLLTENQPTGDITAGTTLLRVGTEDDYLEVGIE